MKYNFIIHFCRIFHFIIVILFMGYNAGSQNFKHVQVEQAGDQVKITYDLSGGNSLWNVQLFYTIDEGKIWRGPLMMISGNAGKNQTGGSNKILLWDAISEIGSIKGMVQFKLVAEIMPAKILESNEISRQKKPENEKDSTSDKLLKSEVNKPWKFDSEYKKHTLIKSICLASAIAGAGSGFYSLQKRSTLYEEYKTAQEGAGELRKKIELHEKIYPVAFSLAGIFGAVFVIESVKTGKIKNKIKKQFGFTTFPVTGGSGLKLTYNF